VKYFTACREHQLPVLLGSMRRFCKPFHLFVLAWDFEQPSGEDFTVIPRADLFARHPDYLTLPGPPRETINQIDTCRWRAMADLLRGGRGPLLHVDGDQWFFSSPAALIEEVAGAKLAVSPHRIPAPEEGIPGVTLATHRQYGLYNTGLAYIADAEIAEMMAAACYRWSYSHTEPQPDGTWLFGDQGNLERIARDTGAHVIRHPGVNVAPWNSNRHRLSTRDGQIFVDDVPLVTYHFSSLKWNANGSFRQYADANYCVPNIYIDTVYKPYIDAILKAGNP